MLLKVLNISSSVKRSPSRTVEVTRVYFYAKRLQVHEELGFMIDVMFHCEHGHTPSQHLSPKLRRFHFAMIEFILRQRAQTLFEFCVVLFQFPDRFFNVDRRRVSVLHKTLSHGFKTPVTCCDSVGFDQKLGSEVFFSISANCSRTLGGSKILPQVSDLPFDGAVFAFQFFDHGLPLVAYRLLLIATASAASAIIAQPNANQSPCRV